MVAYIEFKHEGTALFYHLFDGGVLMFIQFDVGYGW